MHVWLLLFYQQVFVITHIICIHSAYQEFLYNSDPVYTNRKNQLYEFKKFNC